MKNQNMYHVYHWTRVDVSVMNAAVFSVSIFPVGGTVVMFTKSPSCFSVYYGAKHIYTSDHLMQDKVWF